VYVFFFLFILIHFRVARSDLKEQQQKYEKTENDLKAVQSTGQIVGEVLKRLDDDRCNLLFATTHIFAYPGYPQICKIVRFDVCLRRHCEVNTRTAPCGGMPQNCE
jgi:hypothetical protein